MPTFEELRTPAEHRSLMLKFSQLLVYTAPLTADPIESITDETGAFLAVPEEYIPVGLLAKDAGVTFPRDVSEAETESVNHSAPTRKDVESDTNQVAFTAQQTTRPVLELAWGLDLSAFTQAASGEVVITRPPIPEGIQRRLLVLAHDPKYKVAAAAFYPLVEPTSFPEVSWGPSEVTSYAITLDAYVDDELGFAVRNIPLAGPGAIAAGAATGFTPATP